MNLRVRPGAEPPTPEGSIALTETPGKRAVDLLLGGTMLLLSAPVWALIALAIKLEDRGPVFYHQDRYGRGGRVIRILKFRSMVADSDQKYGILQARDGDLRITRVGRLLRGCGLDELPQILAIVKGDMSFVGPRPLAAGEIVEDAHGRRIPWETMPGFAERLGVRPGLTSLATVRLPKDVHPRRKFRYDLIYVRHRSLGLDLKLILLSFLISFTGRWERRGRKV
ncbi:MAG TPA: sugar transferase [Gemmatimonadota bacterium]|nr:sugar transferase [Gemmatimonadota bacterium]